MLEFERGSPVNAIAELLNVICQSVYNRIARFQQWAAACELSDEPPLGRPARAGDLVNLALGKVVIGEPSSESK